MECALCGHFSSTAEMDMLHEARLCVRWPWFQLPHDLLNHCVLHHGVSKDLVQGIPQCDVHDVQWYAGAKQFEISASNL